MKKIKNFLIIPLVALIFGLLPQFNVFAHEVETLSLVNLDNNSILEFNKLFIDSINTINSFEINVKKIVFNEFSSTFNTEYDALVYRFYNDAVTTDVDNKAAYFRFQVLEVNSPNFSLEKSDSRMSLNVSSSSIISKKTYRADFIFNGDEDDVGEISYYALSSINLVSESTTSVEVLSNYFNFSAGCTGFIKKLTNWSGDDFEVNVDTDISHPNEKPVDGEYLWISSPKENTKLSGYIGQSLVGDVKLKQFDIEVYGRYLSKNGLFDNSSFIKTSIINSFKLQYGEKTKQMAEGLGLKSFDWIVEPKDGEYAEFRVVLYSSMFEQGSIEDLTVSCTVKRYDGEKQVFSDTVKNIEMLIDNYDDNINVSPPEDGESGEVDGSVEGSKPERPDSLNPLDWIIYILDLIVYYIQSFVNSISTAISSLLLAFQELTTEMTNATAKFVAIFGVLPSPLPQLITLSTTVLCVTTIFRLIRR